MTIIQLLITGRNKLFWITHTSLDSQFQADLSSIQTIYREPKKMKMFCLHLLWSGVRTGCSQIQGKNNHWASGSNKHDNIDAVLLPQTTDCSVGFPWISWADRQQTRAKDLVTNYSFWLSMSQLMPQEISINKMKIIQDKQTQLCLFVVKLMQDSICLRVQPRDIKIQELHVGSKAASPLTGKVFTMASATAWMPWMVCMFCSAPLRTSNLKHLYPFSSMALETAAHPQKTSQQWNISTFSMCPALWRRPGNELRRVWVGERSQEDQPSIKSFLSDWCKYYCIHKF